MRKKASPRSRLDLGLGQANSLELDLGLEKGALADLCIEGPHIGRKGLQWFENER